ncbi:MAG: aminopeptidase [Deltaproteobacteria bacterium]|nr:aminopeptidase [Deltaproteobacteria bacterium]
MRAKAGALAALGLAITVLPGCYVGHLAEGQLRLLRAARPIEEVVADPAAPPEVRRALAEVAPVLDYARALGLEVGDQYRTYAAWPGDRVVTALVATRPGEVEPAGFWFPIVGIVPYKGFFALARAEHEAARLRAGGLDTCLVPVPAYSTLGWFDDPVATPLVRRGPGALAETLLHELVHATVFVAGDADWNEGVATFVGQEGAVRFFAARAGEDAAQAERRRIADERAVARTLRALREQVAALYREPASPAREAARTAAAEATRTALAALPLETLDPAAVAATARLGDACLALAATYEADLDAFARHLATHGGDLAAFVAALREAARADDPRRALGLPPRADPAPTAARP